MVEGGRLEVKGGRWMVEGERLEVKGGKWKVGGGRWGTPDRTCPRHVMGQDSKPFLSTNLKIDCHTCPGSRSCKKHDATQVWD